MNRIFLLALTTLAISLTRANTPATANTSLAKNHAPLSFIENAGQVMDQNRNPRPDIQFSLKAAPGLNIFIGNGAIHYQFSKTDAAPQGAISPSGGGVGAGEPLAISNKPEAPGSKRESYTMYRLDVELVGANPNPEIITEEKQSYYENYYTDWSGEQGATAHAFARITYKNVYPYIDWVFYIKDGQLEHEFIIQEGGKASDIHLKYCGATGLQINKDGTLTAGTPQGTIHEQAPKSYNLSGAPVKTAFKLNGNILSYEMDSYDGELVIDPGLQWATYYLGNGEGLGATAAIDDSDNVYMAGVTSSTAGIATVGAYQSTFGGMSIDAYLVKFNSTGTIQWGTYYGGTADDYGSGTTVDANGNVYLCGFTLSYNGISTIGAYQYTLPLTNNGNAFIAKFTRAGTRLWGTYYGHSGRVEAHNVATDKWGNVYISGQAGSATVSIASAGAYQTVFGGGNFDAFLAKFDSTAAHLRWATYFGGNGVDNENGLAIDTGGNIYISGATLSAAGIASPGAYQTTMGAGGNAFLAKFDTSGARLWATYYGGSQLTQAYAVAVDSPGNAYITGYTLSTTGIATPGAYDVNFEGAGDAFLAKFDGTGSPIWGTYYGGAAKDCALIVAADPLGYIYLGGYTASATGFATPGAYQTIYNGGTSYGDAFFAKFTPTGNRLYGTYYGGTADDLGVGIAADAGGNVFLTGFSASHTNIVTPGAYDTTGATYGSNYISRFATCALPTVSTITGPTTLCALSTITLTDTTTGGTWASSNTNLATVSNGVVTGVSAGLDTITYSVTNGCGTTTVIYRVTVKAVPTINAVTNQTVCAGTPVNAINFTGTGTGTVYNWTCNNTSIGLAASGTGSIAQFTARNAGSAPVTATITATPVSPPGGFAYVTVSGSDSLAVINVNTNVVSAKIAVGANPWGVALSPDQSKVYVVNQNSANISVINTANNTVANTISANIGTQPYCIAVSLDGSKLYVTGGGNSSVFVVSTSTNTLVATTGVGSHPGPMAVSPDGSKVYVCNEYSNSISVMSVATNTIIDSIINLPDEPWGIAVSPDGSKLYVTLSDAQANSNSVSVINCATHLVIANIPVVRYPDGVAISPDGSRVYVTHVDADTVSVISTASNTVINTIPVGIDPEGIAVTSDGADVYAVNLLGYSVSVINASTNTVTNTINVGNIAGQIAISAKGPSCTGAPTTFTITVNPTPTVSITGTPAACGQVSLTATGGTGYTWSGGNSPGTATNTFTSSGTYTVTVSNGGSCSATAQQAVTVNAAPTVNSISNQTVCAGSSTNTLSFTGTGTGVVYNWSCNNTSIGIAANGTGSVGSFTAVNSGSTPVTATVTVTPVSSGTSHAYIEDFGINIISVINTATNTVTGSLNFISSPFAVAVSPDGSQVYVTNQNISNLSVINTATNTIAANIRVRNQPSGVAASPDGRKVYVANTFGGLDSIVSVIDVTTNTVVANITAGKGPYCLAVTPDGSKIYVGNDSSRDVSVVNAATNTVTATIPLASKPDFIAITPDGSTAYVSEYGVNGTGTTVEVISTSTNLITASVTVGSQPQAIAITPDGAKAYVANWGSGTVSVINTSTNTVTATINGLTHAQGISVSPDGSRVYVTLASTASVAVINTATNMVTNTINVSTSPFSMGNFITSNGNGCTGTPITFTITVNPAPTATYTTSTGQTHFCQGHSLTLAAGTETGYLWSTGATTQSIVLHQGGNTGLTVTGNNGCTASTSQNISAFSVPTSAILQHDTAICQGDSVTLTSASQFKYLWSTGATTQNIVVKQTGNYFVVATNPVGCTDSSAPVSVTVNAPGGVAVTANGPTTFCQGGTVTLVTGAANSYLWSNAATTASIDVTQSGNYQVTVNGASSCSATSTATVVTVDTLPAATITPHGPTTFCQGFNVSLVASVGTNYLWSNGETTQLLSAAQAGNYTVTVTNSYTCTAASAPIAVAVYQTGASQFSHAICAGQTFNFNNQNINQTGTYYDTLQTIHGCDSIITLNLAVSAALQTRLIDTTCSGSPYVFNGHSLTQTGIYVDTLQSSAGCDSIVSMHLTVDSTGTPTITRNGNTLSTQSFNSYQWLLNGTTATGSTQSITVTQNGNYSVVVTGAGGCTDTSAVLSVKTLGIQDITGAYSVKLFPNPNNGNFTLQFSDDVVRAVEVTDAVGRTIVPATKVSKQQIFNLEQLAAGVYILKIIENNETKSLKFSVMR